MEMDKFFRYLKREWQLGSRILKHQILTKFNKVISS